MRKIIFIISILISITSNAQIGKLKINSDINEFPELLNCPKVSYIKSELFCEIIADTTTSSKLSKTSFITRENLLIGSFNQRFRSFYIKEYIINSQIKLNNIYLDFFDGKLVKVVIYLQNNLYYGLSNKYSTPNCLSKKNYYDLNSGRTNIDYEECNWIVEKDTISHIRYISKSFSYGDSEKIEYYTLYGEKFSELKKFYENEYRILYQRIFKKEQDVIKASLIKDL